jgi:hypothetical protein
LLGFNIGTVIIHNVGLRLLDEQKGAANGAAVSLEVSSNSKKLSRKNAEQHDEGYTLWNTGDTPVELPVQQRYSTALFVSIKQHSTILTSKAAMAVLWLRDIVDNNRGTVEVAMWSCKDYDAIKHNYLPPDGCLDHWNYGSDGMERIGTVELDIDFKPGFSMLHDKAGSSSDSSKRGLSEEVERRNVAGLREKVGEQGGGERQLDPEQSGNTEVSEEHVEAVGNADGQEHDPDSANSNEDGSDDESKGLMEKLRAWKRHEHELHLHHRGVMQTKPARTAVWVKNNMKSAGKKMTGRFAMKTRQPDVETEV